MCVLLIFHFRNEQLTDTEDVNFVPEENIGENMPESSVESQEKLASESYNLEVGRDSPQGSNSGFSFPTIYHKDLYLLFRALCKLSMKGISEESSSGQNEAIAVQNK